jgi:hypothetical protein
VIAESAVKAKRELPESPSQAKEFDRRKRAYRDAGLCHACAAQAAFGHQMGFLQVHPPCASCVPVVTGFPYPAENSWRRFRRGRSLGEVATWPMPVTDPEGGPDDDGHLTWQQTAA